MLKKTKKKIYNILIWSQKYTKTDMVYLAKGGFWLNLSQIITSIAGLILTVAFANLLPPETYGTFKFIIAFVGILSIPTLGGMNTALVRAAAQGNESTVYPALKTKIKWGVWGAMGALGLAGYYFYNGNSTLGFSFLVIAGFIPFLNTLEIWMSYLSGKKRFKTMGKYKSLTRILVVSAIITSLFFTQNLFLVLFIHLVANTGFKLLFLLLSLKKFPPNKKTDPASIGYGKHLSLMGILSAVSNQIDKILLFHYLGPVQLAVYTFSLRPINEIKKTTESFSKLSFPKISQRNFSELKKSLPGKMLKFSLVLIPIVAIYIFLAPYFYNLLFPLYEEAIPYSRVFALSLLLYPKFLISQTLTAHAPKKQLYIIRITTPVFKIILLASLLPWLGIWGVIAALLGTEIFSLIINFFFFYKKNNKKTASIK